MILRVYCDKDKRSLHINKHFEGTQTSKLKFETDKLNNLSISFGSLTIRILDVGGTQKDETLKMQKLYEDFCLRAGTDEGISLVVLLSIQL